MSGTQWTQEQILLFLETLQAETIIWNPNESGHKDKKKINDAWVRMRDILEIPIEELKKKKDSLFATYRGYCRKKDASIKSGAGADEVYRPVWFAFDLMDSFLGSVFKCKPTISTDPETDSIQEQNNASGDVETITSQTPREQNSVEPSQTRPTIRRRDNPPELQVASKQMTEAFNNLNKIINKKPAKDVGDVEDECDIFGKLIAMKLKKVPEHERDHLMFDIHALFRRRRSESPSIESSRSSTTYYSFTPSNVSIKRPRSARMVSPRPHSSFSEPPIAYATSDQSNEGQHTYIEQPNEETSHQRSSNIHIISDDIIPKTQLVSRRYKLPKSQNTAVHSNAMVSPRPHSSYTEPSNAFQSNSHYILHIPESQTQSVSPDDNTDKSDLIYQAFYDS